MRNAARSIVAVGIAVSAAQLCGTADARHPICSAKAYNRADASLPAAGRSWSTLNRHWQFFRQCDDGALAEGYSDAVVRLLANRWRQFDAFASLARRDSDFRRWAIAHIDASASSNDLRVIVQHARRCADRSNEDLCRRVERAARAALAER
jgi:hypothetical protein